MTPILLISPVIASLLLGQSELKELDIPPTKRFVLCFLPESNSIVPYQPLRFRVVLQNLTDRLQIKPGGVLPTGNQRYYVKTTDSNKVIAAGDYFWWDSEDRGRMQPHEMFMRSYMHQGPSPFGDGERDEDAYWPLTNPGRYKLQVIVANRPGDEPVLKSNVVEIEVREPKDDEREIGQFLRLYLKGCLKDGRVYVGLAENREQLKALLKKYPNSSLSDELRYYLALEPEPNSGVARRLELLLAIAPHKKKLREPLLMLASRESLKTTKEQWQTYAKLQEELILHPPLIDSREEQQHFQRMLDALKQHLRER